MTDRADRLAERLRYWRDVQGVDLSDATETARIAVDFINAEVYPNKLSPYARCSTCSAPLDVSGRPWSRSCGGDCIACMAEAGDPECAEAVAAMRAGKNARRDGLRRAVEVASRYLRARDDDGEAGEVFVARQIVDALEKEVGG